MDERYEKLLHCLVVDYIATAQPVGSVRLCDVAGLDVSPATIRNMLRDLEQEGYIVQPHTSAGRIPTDKGYRWYVNQLVVRDITKRRLEALAGRYYEMCSDRDNTMRPAAKMLSDLAKTLAISGLLDKNDIYEIGLSRLFDLPEGADIETVREATTIADAIDTHIEAIVDDARGQIAIYIGSENPGIPVNRTSILARTITMPTGQEAMLLLVGPKRMPYERHIPLLEAMATIMERGKV